MKAKKFDITCGGAAQRSKNKVSPLEPEVPKQVAQVTPAYCTNLYPVKSSNVLWPVQSPMFSYPAPYMPTQSMYPIYERNMQPMQTTDLGDVTVRYLDTERFFGRGGKIRFYLRAKQIEHTYATIEVTPDSIEDFNYLKQQLISTGVNPNGQLPILHHEGHTLCETFSIMRYLAKRLHEYGSDIFKDYLSDMIIDKLAYWTDDIMNAIREAITDTIGEGIQNYLRQREIYYQTFESLLKRYEAYLVNPMKTINAHLPWTLCALAATLCDDLILVALCNGTDRKEPEDYLLTQSPKLLELYKNICDIPTLHELMIERGLVKIYTDSYPNINQSMPSRIVSNTKTNTTAESVSNCHNAYVMNKNPHAAYMCYGQQNLAPYPEDYKALARASQEKYMDYGMANQQHLRYPKLLEPSNKLTTN